MKRSQPLWNWARFARQCLLLAAIATTAVRAEDTKSDSQAVINDSHVHLTNYIQEGTNIHEYLKLMGTRVNRSVLFGIPLQQQWSYRVQGNDRPTYYLDTDAPLYYYSFTDAVIATAYQSLTAKERVRFDPMITGFNPTDMYAADHVRRVLETFPGVFEGIGEFTIHKEFVSSKVAGEVASLQDPALDRLLDFAGEVGLVALIHNDMTMPEAKPGAEPEYYSQMVALLKRHPNTVIIWAHMGMGRVVRPVDHHAALIERILEDPAMRNVYFDLSWIEVSKYLMATPETVRVSADLMRGHPDRFLFGSDEVAPKTQKQLLTVLNAYGPLWNALDATTREKIRRENYLRLFDEARRRVRAWEAKHAKHAPAEDSPRP